MNTIKNNKTSNEDKEQVEDTGSIQQNDLETNAAMPRRSFLIFIYTLGLALLHTDYNLIAPNLTQIADDFGFTEDERDTKLGGQIALAFFLCGAPPSFLAGWLCDKFDRRALIFAIVIMIGELACFATYFVNSFAFLITLRSITGMAIGASLPCVYSVLGDVFQSEGRNASSGLIATSIGIGLGIGQAISGYLGPKYGWNLPFLIVSIPSFFVAFCTIMFLPEPKRGAAEQAVIEMREERNATYKDATEDVTNLQSSIERVALQTDIENQEKECIHPYYIAEAPSYGSTLKMLRTPTMIILLIQGAPNVIPFGIISVYLNDYLSQDKGLSVEEATSVLIMFGAGNAIGVLVGSTMGHFAYKKDVRLPSILMGTSILATILPMYFLINMTLDRGASSVAKASMLTFVTGFLSIFPVSIERAILANVIMPEARGRANALLSIIDELGKGLGPFLLSFMISSLGRKAAFNLSLLGWLVGGLVTLGMFWTIRTDEAKLQEEIRERINRNIEREN